MNKMKETQVWIVSLMLAVIILFYISSSLILDIQREYEGIQRLRMDYSPISKERVETIILNREMSKENSPSYTAWLQKSNVALENSNLKRIFKGKVIYYCGDSRGDFQSVLDNGCALTQDAAYALWGTTQVMGENVKIEGKNYIVETLLPSGGASIIKAKGEEEILFNVLDVDISKKEGEFSGILEILTVNQLTSNIFIDGNYLIELMEKLKKIPLWIVSLMIACYLGKLAYGISKNEIRLVAATVVIVVVIIVAYFILGTPISFSPSFVPTKWSDFDFWKDTFSMAMEKIRGVFSMELYEPDILLRGTMLKIIFICSVQTLLLIHIFNKAKTFIEEETHGIHYIK